ncbi:MAG: hypothetical protein AB198_02895 [Parcubacteria bacterium C7867-003]|nr:MAG: hypothetical protein AB198_02895 [Parcubacteria bacterium C7867-003]
MALTSFIVSFVALASLIALKLFETKVRKIGVLERAFIKGDTLISSGIDWMFLRYNYYKKVGHIFVFDFIPSLAYEVLVKLKDKVAKRYYNAGNEFRGRRILRSDGSVSSFLERLSEDK